MSDYFESNIRSLFQKESPVFLNALKDVSPLSIVSCTEGGGLTFEWNGRYIHSKRDAIKEVERRYASFDAKGHNRFLVISNDLLYALENVLSKEVDLDTQFYIYYMDIQVLKTLMVYRDLTFLFKYVSRIHWFVGDYQNLPQLINCQNMKKTLVLDNLQINVMFDNEMRALRELYYNEVEAWFSSAATKFYFERLWTKSAMENIINTKSYSSLENLKGALEGQKMILVGAGPSLYGCLEDLKTKQDNYIIISSDSAIPILLEYGISFDYIVSQDGGYYNYLDFLTKGVGERSVPLLADVISYPKISRYYPHDVYFFRTHNKGENESVIGLLCEELSITLPALESTSTVIHTALNVIEYMGGDEVILMGLDMGYPFYHTHCVGGIHFFYFYRKSNYFNSMDTQEFQVSGRSGSYEEAMDGSKTFMSRQSHMNLSSFEPFLEKLKLSVYKSLMMKNELFRKCSVEDFYSHNFKKKEKLDMRREALGFGGVQKLVMKLKAFDKIITDFRQSISKGDFSNFETQREFFFIELRKLHFLEKSLELIIFGMNRFENTNHQKMWTILTEYQKYIHILLSKIKKSLNP